MEELDLKAIIESDIDIPEKLETVLVTLIERMEKLEEGLYYCRSGISDLIHRVDRLEVWMHQEKGKE